MYSQEAELENYYKIIGPKLEVFWAEIRLDVDTEQQGGILTSLAIFFPNEASLMRLDEKKRRLYLQLFLCIENWFQEVHSSL